MDIQFSKVQKSSDKLDRINEIRNPQSAIGNPVADYGYIGPGRVLERTYSNGVRLTYLNDARQRDVGYDELKRVVSHRHLRQDNRLVAGFAYDHDRANNKLVEVQQHDNNRREDYVFDSIYRLERYTHQGEPEESWQLDGASNWTQHQDASIQANNMNEYTAFARTQQFHDDNGNLVDDGASRYQYDFANRLRRVIRKSDNAVIAVYRYDAHNRRTERIVTNTAGLNDRVRYLYDGWREIEEQRARSTQQYVYGMWIDEPLTLDKDENNDGTVDQSFFYHQDRKTHVVAITSNTGEIVERVSYDVYGEPNSKTSSVGNPYLFHGRRYDPETQHYYYRARFYDPARGRFLQRDPIGVWSDAGNLGNGYTFVGNDPVNGKDPRGLKMTLDQCGLWTDFDQEGGGPFGIYQPGVGCVGGQCSDVSWSWERGYHLNPRFGGESGYDGDTSPNDGCFISEEDGDGDGDGGGPPPGPPLWCFLGNNGPGEINIPGGGDNEQFIADSCLQCGGFYVWTGTGVNKCYLGLDTQWSCMPDLLGDTCLVQHGPESPFPPEPGQGDVGRPAPAGPGAETGPRRGGCRRAGIRQVRGFIGPTEFIRRPMRGLIR